MKKTGLLLLLSFFCIVCSHAQEKKETFIDHARVVADKVRYSTEGLLKIKNGHDNSKDLIRIKGYYYMPIYDVNLYKGTDARTLQEECRKIFAEKFPTVKIMTVVCPQTDWIHENIKKHKTVIGYLETMYCYIIAKDGNDGYINARYSFKRYKEVGDTYGPLIENWPKQERLDFLTPEIYQKLLTK